MGRGRGTRELTRQESPPEAAGGRSGSQVRSWAQSQGSVFVLRAEITNH